MLQQMPWQSGCPQEAWIQQALLGHAAGETEPGRGIE